MGNLCGKSSQADDPFSQPGRTLGSTLPVQNTNAHAPIPSRVTKPPPQIRGPGRTVGAAGGATAGESGLDDPRTAAAKAAEERAHKGPGKGKLGEQLAARKRQTQATTLEQASREERGARDADASTEARNWN